MKRRQRLTEKGKVIVAILLIIIILLILARVPSAEPERTSSDFYHWNSEKGYYEAK